ENSGVGWKMTKILSQVIDKNNRVQISLKRSGKRFLIMTHIAGFRTNSAHFVIHSNNLDL
ncbi:MAG TPA: hypothetical protein VFJ05_06195, partial [Nitrososphaeraceae archaeon]|nr:hypothetical protein [Nitrososphaeraceae archaeon]